MTIVFCIRCVIVFFIRSVSVHSLCWRGVFSVRCVVFFQFPGPVELVELTFCDFARTMC